MRRAIMWLLLWASDVLAWCGLNGSWLWWRLIWGAAYCEAWQDIADRRGTTGEPPPWEQS